MPARIARVAGFAALAAGLCLAAGPAAADGKKGDKKGSAGKRGDGDLDPRGKPKKYEPGAAVNYWIWYEADEDRWHLRTTTKGKPHRFVGLIEVAGGGLKSVQIPKADGLGPNSDKIAWNNEKNAFVFDFTTEGKADGVDFRLEKAATRLKFTLSIDGKAAADHIRIGRDGDHPPDATFVYPAHPGKKGK